MRLEFWVSGTPVPKGSVEARPNMSIDHGERVRNRERDIADAAREAMRRIGWRTIRQPMAVEVLHYAFVPLPAGADRYDAPTADGDRDVDKLPRTVFDALTAAQVWADDVQVVRLIADQHYAVDDIATDPPLFPGDFISVEVIGNHAARRMAAAALSSRARALALGPGAGAPVPSGW